jgi:glyoxylase-like metal-dependent hydrolase (beta-lactamase superfamily II)
MTCFICATCGTQFAESEAPPASCPICTDDRQYIGWSGQHWTTHADLAAMFPLRLDIDGDLLGVGLPGFGIPQRALHLRTDAGNILWETLSVVTDEAVAELEAEGGVDLIAISHPHFYAAMVEWSDALGGVPILINAADQDWVQRWAPAVEPWHGDEYRLSPTVTLYRCPGHFPGSTVLHWTAGPRGRKLLLTGDSLHVTQDRRHVAFQYSVPNHLPAHPADVAEAQARLHGLEFDDVYGFTWGLNIAGDARAAVDASFERYFRAIGQAPRDASHGTAATRPKPAGRTPRAARRVVA